ncbi:helix-turn-helix transcriptional regulator [Nocardia pseudovaccinii]|uniref:helix-turn-helix transcriptional regulator n=1 Tax=Nocardia pseudovaccinii TaxID=189540 RepID=UPI002480AAA6|nr:AraC family transcriptional regulator [Nocardia pseudovaccinii]
MFSSPTVRSAIEVGLRYVDLTFSFCRIETRAESGEARLILSAPDVPLGLRRFFIERDAGALQTLRQELAAFAVPLRRIEFAFPVPVAAVRADYDAVFGQPVHFEAEENAMVLDLALLDLPLPQADTHTAALTRAQCRDLLTRRRARTGLAGQVRNALLAELPQQPTAAGVAAKLHMSDRTLRHRLAAEGTSFRTLLDEVREHLAVELLITGGLPAEQIARRLGYSEVSSFSHAFRRWKGMGPRAFRTKEVGRPG